MGKRVPLQIKGLLRNLGSLTKPIAQALNPRPLNSGVLLAGCRFLELGRALGHFTFSLIGLKRILFTNIFQTL